MRLLDRLRRLFFAPQPHVSIRQLAGGRISTDKSQEPAVFGFFVESPPTPELDYRTLNLDSKTLDRISPARLLEMLADLSPDVSRALWDFLRFTNPGYEVKAFAPGSEEQSETAQQSIEGFVDTLSDLHGDFNVLIGRLFLGVFLRGGLLAELVLDESGRDPVDLATPDPHSVRFRRLNDPLRGIVWQLGQWQAGQWVPLDRETIRYIPVDPFPGSPYGRPLVNPALFTSLFLLGMLHDIRRVISQQGYPRLDLVVNLERLASAMPEDARDDPEAFKDWVNEVIGEVEDVYASLEPDDAYVHTDVVEVNSPVGAIGGGTNSGLQGANEIIVILERMSVRALKSMPLMFGINEATTETNAIRQWEIFAAGIKSIQHFAEVLFERLFGLALEAQGIQADVEFRFAELRASEMMRDAQTEAIQINNAYRKYAAGWVSQDAASEEVTGHLADVPEPRVALATEVPDLQDIGYRSRYLDELRTTRRDVARAIKASMNGYEARNGTATENQ